MLVFEALGIIVLVAILFLGFCFIGFCRASGGRRHRYFVLSDFHPNVTRLPDAPRRLRGNGKITRLAIAALSLAVPPAMCAQTYSSIEIKAISATATSVSATDASIALPAAFVPVNGADADPLIDEPAPVCGPAVTPQNASAPAICGSPAVSAGFFARLGRAYVVDWTGNPPITKATRQKFRGTPPPIASPPFPGSYWPIGGTPVIGAADGQSYPLMQAINQNQSRYKIYGWLEVGANGSTNNRGNASKGIPANWPSAYDEYPNIVQLDQAALYYERLPDTVQKEHFDWGWRLTTLYGVDYRFTTAKGMLSQQLLVKNAQYGFDPVMFYTDLYFPRVADGMNVRIGRYISLPDIEAQLAPNNYTYSHSILYTFDCYTQTGINATVKLNNHWTVQAGLSPGCDVMPWTTDAKITGNTCAQYSWNNGGDALYTCANSLNDGKYAYNNLAAYYETWYHKFNGHWHTDTEAWYQSMRATPNMYWYNGTDPATGIQYASTAATPWPEATNYRPGGGAATLNFGAVCVDPRLPASAQPARCFAPEWAITNYVEHNFMHNEASLNIRNEFVDDIKGQRTGTPAKYEEHMVGLNFWVGSTITFRPEVSYIHAFGSYGLMVLDISPGSAVSNLQNGINQAGKTQDLILAADLIWHF